MDHTEWCDYFRSIRRVCPWAYADWCAGSIQILETYKPIPLGDYTARVYVVDIHSHDLRAYSEYLNDTRDDEWFYSDPNQGEYSDPITTPSHICDIENACLGDLIPKPTTTGRSVYDFTFIAPSGQEGR